MLVTSVSLVALACDLTCKGGFLPLLCVRNVFVPVFAVLNVLDAKIKCPDILNNDIGTITIGTESFDGPNTALCERPVAA